MHSFDIGFRDLVKQIEENETQRSGRGVLQSKKANQKEKPTWQRWTQVKTQTPNKITQDKKRTDSSFSRKLL